MQFSRRILIALFVGLPLAHSQNVGAGSPDAGVNAAFLNGYYRNNFLNLVSLPAIANVAALGSAGYVQQFHDAANTTGVTYALVVPVPTSSNGTDYAYQLYPAVYAYYQQIGVITAGYPTTDTQQCPAFPGNACTFQYFSKNYALFAYSSPITSASGTTFFTSDPFYTKWQSLGGVNTIGPVTSAETAYTSPAGNIATIQTYLTGMIGNITSGAVSARTVGVQEPVWDFYVTQGGYTGSMGLPLSDPLVQANGHLRQMFENGAVDYIPNQPGSVTFLEPVKTIQIAPSPSGGTLQLNLGQTATLTAAAFGSDGTALNGRIFTWNTTSGLIVSIQSTGASATIKATGGGAATITVSSEGVVSSPLNVFVIAPCCAVGQGAPTAALQQSFQNAVARDQLNPVLPAASPVTRVGSGYLQQFISADTGNPFWLAAALSTGNAYLLQGPLLTAYEAAGGPTGSPGYPISDPTPGGRQNFENGALAGAPVQLVSGPILGKWASLGYETGPAGSPTASATPFLTFAATSGTSQTFANAEIFAISSGPQTGNVYSIAGPILAAYTGPTSNLGVPTGDEYSTNGLEQQDFEGGYMQYSPGDSIAQVYPTPRVPTVTATPASAPAGGIVRLTLGGFSSNAQVQVSATGQQSFVASLPSGAYIWETYIPAAATSSTVTIQALDLNSQASAQATYTVRGGASANISLTAIQGDTQTGPPGATLPLPVKVRLADTFGNPIPNARVHFTPSPGGAIASASTATDGNGVATVAWRLPPTEGTALLAVNAGGHLVNVTASALHSGLSNFPSLSQAGISTPLGNGTSPISSSGALLVSAAAAIRYYQGQNALPKPNGLADALTLNTFLKTVCGLDSTGAALCDGFLQPAGATDQIVNLWRLRGFTGNALDVRSIAGDPNLIRDAIAQGAPVVLALSLTVNGTPGVSHFVVATGVDANGNLNIMDPNPAYGQTSLYGYLYGFQSPAKATVTGTLTGAAVFLPQVPANPGFLIAVSAATTVQSPSGTCGAPFGFPISSGAFALHYCDASTGPFYELDLSPASPGSNALHLSSRADLRSARGFEPRLGRPEAGGGPEDRPTGAEVNGIASSPDFQGWFIDLTGSLPDTNFSGTAPASYTLDDWSGQWAFAPLTVQFQGASVVNPVSKTAGVAPGGLASIIGTGLAGPGDPPVVAVNGENAQVVIATPFELDFQIPADATPGSAVVDVVSDVNGSAEQTITILPVAPAIQAAGGILNQDGSVNSRYHPAQRGQTITVIGTGFGPFAGSGPPAAAVPVVAMLGGNPVVVKTMVLAPDSPGLYQLTLLIPTNLPPGLALDLVFQQGGITSNTVSVAIE